MVYYPVCIPTLCRYDHFRSCVESLKACTHASNTELIVSVDYPMKPSHEEGRLKILEYLSSLSGFSTVTVFKQEKNLGAGGNWSFLQDYTFNKYGAAIFSEDDNVFAPCFLDYMDKALAFYWDDNTVMTITAYSPIGYEVMKEPVFFSYSLCAWGLGCWKHKKYDNVFDISYYNEILKNTKKSLKLFKRAPYILAGLVYMAETEEELGDYGMGAQNILNDTYQLRPTNSLVINCGQDGSGLHSGENATLHKMEIERGLPQNNSFECDFTTIKVETSAFVKRYMFWRYGGVGKYHIIPQIKSLVKYFIYRIKIK